ncbi:MAG: hypothetical protein P8N61_00440 [Porticoccaceae bacterium]|nr:hypothetical protein [Porticoccaceae bacterium]
MRNIIVLGSGYSGSGAVFDYLVGRDDCLNPLNSNEARWINDPGGVIDFLNRLDVFYPALASDAYEEFLIMSREFEGHLSISMKSNLQGLLKDMLLMDYQAMPLYKINKMNKLQVLTFRVFKKLGLAGMNSRVYLPKSRDQLLKLFTDFFSNFKGGLDEGIFVFNQAGSYWNPEQSTECFGIRKVVRVSRDPRDIYADLKNKRSLFPTNSVEEFCKWFKESQVLIQSLEWEHCIDIKFEDFVTNFDRERKSLCDFLEIPSEIDSSYSVADSRVNMGKNRRILSQYESSFIEDSLSDFTE